MPKTIYDMVMPDLLERRARYESVIASHSNPEYAAQVCKGLSPLFFFLNQKSYEMMDEPGMLQEVEEWCKIANKRSIDFMIMLGWLARMTVMANDNDKYKEIQRLMARHLALTDRNKPKLRKRLLRLIDSKGEEVPVLKLFRDENVSSIGEAPNSDSNETYIDDSNTFIDEDGDIKPKRYSCIESVDYEEGIPRTDRETAKLITKRLVELKNKEETEGITEDERKERNKLQELVFKGQPRFDYPRADKAAANLRRGCNHFCQKLDKDGIDPWFGSKIVKAGFKSGRTCCWKSEDIDQKWEGPKKGLETISELFELLMSKPWWWGLERRLLSAANLDDLNMMNTLYDAGRHKKWLCHGDLSQIPSFMDLYQHVKKTDHEVASSYLSSKANLMECMKEGMKYYKIM